MKLVFTVLVIKALTVWDLWCFENLKKMDWCINEWMNKWQRCSESSSGSVDYINWTFCQPILDKRIRLSKHSCVTLWKLLPGLSNCVEWRLLSNLKKLLWIEVAVFVCLCWLSNVSWSLDYSITALWMWTTAHSEYCTLDRVQKHHFLTVRDPYGDKIESIFKCCFW